MSVRPRSIPFAGWVFLLALVVRLLVFFRFADSPFFLPTTGGDMKFYAQWGARVAAGEWTDHRAFYGLPGYPFLLGAIFFLFGFAPFLVGLLQVGCEAAVAALIFRLGEKTAPGTVGRVGGGLAALGWIFFQPAQAFSMILMPTSWLILAFWGLVAWSLRERESGRPASAWRPWLGMGLLTGFGSMFIATLLFVLPLPAAAAWARLRRRPRALLGALAALALGVFGGSAPCWVHNFFVAREPVFLSAHSGINFWVGNNPGANGYPRMPPGLRASQEGMLADSVTQAETAAGRPLKRAEVSRFWSQKASRYIRAHPTAWLTLMGVKVRNLWNAFQYDDLSVIAPMAEEGILTPGLRFGAVAALAIAGASLCLGAYPRARWIAAAVLLHLAALLPVFVTERYRLAAVPGLLLLGGLGLARLGLLLRQRPPGWLNRVAGFGMAGALGAAWVWLPIHEPSLQSLEAYNTGIKAIEFGNLALAERKLSAAYAAMPGNAEVNFALGNLWLARENPEKARWFYLESLRLEPGAAAGVLRNLGAAALMRKDWAEACKALREAARREPESASGLYLLAHAEQGAGNIAAARRALGRALELRPGQPEFLRLQEALNRDGAPVK